MKLVVDTSIFIDDLRGGKVWTNVLKDIAGKDVELILPTIVIFELFSGKSSKEGTIKSRINKFLDEFEKVELDAGIAKLAGRVYLDTKGQIDTTDYLIAATTLSVGGTLLTLNKKHFEKIPNLSLYPL